MSFKTAIAGLAAIVVVAGSVLTPTVASAQRGHAHGRGFHAGGGGFRGFRGSGIGIYPGWGYYPGPYYYGPMCGYVLVTYYHHHRAYQHWVYTCQ